MISQIYLFNEGSAAAIYGIGTYIRQMVAILSSCEDIRLTVVQSMCVDVKEYSVEELDGYRQVRVPQIKLLRSEKDFVRYYRNLWRLLRQTVEPDVPAIFHFNYHQEYPLVNHIRADLPKSHFCFTIHYQMWCFALQGNVRQYKEILHKKPDSLLSAEKKVRMEYDRERMLFEAVDSVICLSGFTQKLIEEEYGIPSRKIHRISNGIKDDFVSLTPEERLSLRRKLFFDDDEKIILFVGRLDSGKGLEFLIHAFARVNEQVKSRLVIVGDGNTPVFQKAGKGYWNRITFTGRLEKEDLYAFYRVADVGVMPSFHEQCSYVAIEMLMMDVPLVLTDAPGLGEMQPDSVSRIPVCEEDGKCFVREEELADAILQRLTKPTTLQGRTDFLNRYAYANMEKTYLDFYARIMKEKG